MKKLIWAVGLVLTASLPAWSQVISGEEPKYTDHNKGKFFIYWGGNRASYSHSDIQFEGPGYDFTLNDVGAVDKPKGFHIDYLNPLRMTIPQTNLRVGYFLTDKYSISFGVDHMKYVMVQNQNAVMNGQIEGYAPFDGTYVDHTMPLTEDFLTFEHTDGLNYVNVELSRMDDIGKVVGLTWNGDKIQFNTVAGIGAGVLYPKTNSKLMGMDRHDAFHIAGYGLSAKAGLNITFFKHFFVQGELKGGYINMPDIRTAPNSAHKASQDFRFWERMLVVGTIFRL